MLNGPAFIECSVVVLVRAVIFATNSQGLDGAFRDLTAIQQRKKERWGELHTLTGFASGLQVAEEVVCTSSASLALGKDLVKRAKEPFSWKRSGKGQQRQNRSVGYQSVGNDILDFGVPSIFKSMI